MKRSRITRLRLPPLLMLLLLMILIVVDITQAKTCLMMYQMADNTLEHFIRRDYEELSESRLLRSDDVRVWIYYDAYNQGGRPLPQTIDRSGQEVQDQFHGSRYITYDASLDKMKVELEFQYELNSDLELVIQSFLEYAMSDCLNDGYDQTMAVFASHGGGFGGFGGDKNTRQRQLLEINLQTNAKVASAIRKALDNFSVDKLDVLGFDSCLMQAIGAADDYKDVAHYILASEAVEPGHGWAYESLTRGSSPMVLAKDIVRTFLTGTHGRSVHLTPKQLSILDTNKFVAFIITWENLCAELLSNLQLGDVSLHSFVSRARASAVAYEGLVDVVGTSNPSALDVGSFMTQLEVLCNPGGDLGFALVAARLAYEEMFVASGVGPGTSAGTGIHITWPHQGGYNSHTTMWNQVLFEDERYVTQITPAYRAFLSWFLTSSTPSSNNGVASVCLEAAEPDLELIDPDALILRASGVNDTTTGNFNIETEISTDVSQMWVEYGIDLTTPLKPFLADKGYTPREDEYLFLLGGDVLGTYNGAKFTSSWDQNFYFLNITGGDVVDTTTNETKGGFEALYVYDEGGGSKKVPAMYFPDNNREEVARLGLLDYLFFDIKFWERNGGRFSFLKFSVDQAVGRVNDNLALFVSDGSKGFSEMPREAGGLIVPLIYVDAFIQGQKLNILPGGFNQTVIQWATDLNYNVLTTHASKIFDVIPSTDAVLVNVYAYNHGDPNAPAESRSYDVIRPYKPIDDTETIFEATQPPLQYASDGPGRGTKVATVIAIMSVLLVIAGYVICCCGKT